MKLKNVTMMIITMMMVTMMMVMTMALIETMTVNITWESGDLVTLLYRDGGG